MKVPISQWNESHPLWQRFNPAKPTIGAPSAASSLHCQRPGPSGSHCEICRAHSRSARPGHTRRHAACSGYRPCSGCATPPNTINSVNQWVQADTQSPKWSWNKAIARRKVELQTAPPKSKTP